MAKKSTPPYVPPPPPNEETRKALIEYFRSDMPQQSSKDVLLEPVFMRASKACKIPMRNCRHAWLIGWRDQPPIRDMLLREQAAARFMQSRLSLAAQLAEEYAAAGDDVILRRAIEGTGIRILQSMADSVVSELAQAAGPLIRQALGVLARNPPQNREEARGLLRDLAYATKAAGDLKEQTAKLERLMLGEPTEILGLAVSEAPSDLATIEAEVEAAKRALAWAKEEYGIGGGGNGAAGN